MAIPALVSRVDENRLKSSHKSSKQAELTKTVTISGQNRHTNRQNSSCETTNRTFYTRIKYEPACIYLMYTSYKDNIAKNKTASRYVRRPSYQSFFFFLFLSFFFFFLLFLNFSMSSFSGVFALDDFFEPVLRESIPEDTRSIVSLFIE